MAKRNDWSEQELSEAVDAYLEMLHKDETGIPYVKSKCYQNLADKFGRTPKAFGRRMSNITHIMMLMDLPVVSGLGRLPNVGLKQAPIIERLIADKLKHTYTGVGLTDAEMQSVVKAKKTPKKPTGDETPGFVETTTKIYMRSGKVKGWVIRRADGNCELCGDDAPFEKEDGTPFLEVHHLTRLKDDGPDTVENCAALCPNCHRKLHYSSERKALTKALRKTILEKESGL
ncbi:HNH endonuclease signature motif containing protein [Vibrio diabolicus]|uniref:HNH endonuclease n=1 Tax=Vibrio diabolicus TaxID=50719 RepID=UPI0021D2F59D